jgi:hypothetical protein
MTPPPKPPTLDEAVRKAHEALDGIDANSFMVDVAHAAIDRIREAAEREGRRADAAEEALMECRLSASKLAQDNLTIGATMAREARKWCADYIGSLSRSNFSPWLSVGLLVKKLKRGPEPEKDHG